MHVALFRRHGLTVREPYASRTRTFWPEQVLRDAVACLAVMIVVLVLVLRNYPSATADLPPGDVIGRRARRTGRPGRELRRRPARELTSCSCSNCSSTWKCFRRSSARSSCPGS